PARLRAAVPPLLPDPARAGGPPSIDRPPAGAGRPRRLPLPAAAPVADGPALRRAAGRLPGHGGGRRPPGPAAVLRRLVRGGAGPRGGRRPQLPGVPWPCRTRRPARARPTPRGGLSWLP